MKKYINEGWRIGLVTALFAVVAVSVWSVGEIKALPASAQVGAGIPSCTMTTGGPVITSGGTGKLYYEVMDRPTIITISPEPAGTVQVGAPDPGRVDGRAVGSVTTGPISATTKFTMTVTNSLGTATCATFLQYIPRPAGGWKVPMVKRSPVFTRFQIPGGFDTTYGHMPFYTSYWVPEGFFVINGPGNSGAGLGRNTPAPYRTAKNVFEAGGMYLLKEDGTYVATRDVVFDSSKRAAGCFELAGCTAGPFIHILGNGKFIRDLQPREVGFPRGPILYSVSSAGVNMDQRLFYNDRLVNTSEQTDPIGRLESFSSIAVAGGKMIGVSARYAGWFPVGPQEQGVPGAPRHRYSLQNEVYDLNFMKIASFSTPAPSREPGQSNYSGAPPTTIPLFYPVVGVGDYIVGANSGTDVGYVGGLSPKIYKMPSTNDLAKNIAPAFVQTLFADDRYAFAYAIDSADANRIAFFTLPKSAVAGTTNPSINIYRAGTAGLTKVSERTLSSSAAKVSGFFMSGSAFAVSGDYLGYGTCPMGRSDWTGGRGGTEFNACGLVVEKISTGEKLSVEPLPLSRLSDFGIDGLSGLIGDAQAIGSVAIAPSGRILVTTGSGPNSSGGDNGNVYLYQIGGVSGGGGGGGNGTSTQVSARQGLIEKFGKSGTNLILQQIEQIKRLLQRMGISIQ